MFSEINNHIFCWSADNAGVVPTGFYAIYCRDGILPVRQTLHNFFADSTTITCPLVIDLYLYRYSHTGIGRRCTQRKEQQCAKAESGQEQSR